MKEIDKLIEKIEKIKDEILFIKKELKKVREDVDDLDVKIAELKKHFEKHQHVCHGCVSGYPEIND
jgi:peptidoglycan hydrolase CwlO-like protein